MKKQWLWLVTLILILPISYATITIDGPSKDSYNIGDKLDIKVKIIEPQEIHGLLKLELNCETTSPLLIKTISLEPNEVYNLDENLPTPYFLTGTCSILASIQNANSTLDQSQSKSFKISSELVGNLKIDKTEAQLGEKIILSGTITKQDNTLLNGIINIYFKNNENIVQMETLEIKKGALNYEFDTTSKPAGTYIIQIDASDVYSNKYSSSDLTFNLIDQLTLDLQLEKTDVLPDSTFKLSGIVKDIKSNLVKDGKVTVSIEDQLYITELSRGSFTQKITISETIKSGSHTIHVIIEDNFGNKAEKDISFSVIPVPTVLELKTSEESIKPESVFKITAFVYDQAADKLNEKTKVEVLSPNKEKVLEKEVSTEEEINVEIPQSSSPGLWIITGYASGLKTKKQITVEEVSSISTSLEDQSLKITNTGNINYKEPIPVIFKNTEGAVSKEIKLGLFGLKPTAFAVYDLGKYAETGTYDVNVNNQEFSQIPITNTKSWFSIFYLIPVAIIIVFLIFLFFTKSAPRVVNRPQPIKKKELTEDQLKDKYEREFVGQILKRVEAENQKIQKNLRFDFSPKKEVPQTFAKLKAPIKKDSSIMSTLQKAPQETQPLWRILRKKGLDKSGIKKEEPKKPGLFSMFD